MKSLSWTRLSFWAFLLIIYALSSTSALEQFIRCLYNFQNISKNYGKQKITGGLWSYQEKWSSQQIEPQMIESPAPFLHWTKHKCISNQKAWPMVPCNFLSKYSLHTKLRCTYRRTCRRPYWNSSDKPKDPWYQSPCTLICSISPNSVTC